VSAIAYALLRRAYALPERGLVWVNIVLSCFVGLAHGGALAVASAQQAPELASIRALAMFSLPLAVVVLASGVLALARPVHAWSVLYLHGVVLAASAAWLLVWAAGILVLGVPDAHFVWMVGFLSAWVLYASVVLVRFVVPQAVRTRPVAYYFPAFALLFAVVIDFAVLAKVL
jgi:hypothetical protein